MGNATKKRHHTVWKHYLRAWSEDGRMIWLRRGASVIATNLNNVAVQHRFYSLHEMNREDRRLAEAFIDQIAPDLHFLAKGWLHLFYEIPRLAELSRRESRAGSELDRQLRLLMANFEEDLHAEIESKSLALLADLREADRSLLDDPQKFCQFCLYVSAQFLRTPMDFQLFKATAAQLSIEGSIDTVWGLLRTAFTGVATYFLGSRLATTKLTYLAVRDQVELLAGDRPMVNLAAPPRPTPPARFVVYFPVTPRLGVIVDFESQESGVSVRELGANEVGELNRQIIAASDSQIFGSSRASLEVGDLPRGS